MDKYLHPKTGQTDRIIVHDDVIKWKHFPRNWPFVRGIHLSPVNSPHKGQWRGALMFSLICALNKRLSKQSWGWWFETPSGLLWRHCNVITAELRRVAQRVKGIVYEARIWSPAPNGARPSAETALATKLDMLSSKFLRLSTSYFPLPFSGF